MVVQPSSRSRGDRGASGVEYALVFTFLVVFSIGGAKFLTAKGGAEVNNQANCISQRPPPSSCQRQPATTTTTLPIVTTTATTNPPPPPTTAPPPSLGALTVTSTSNPSTVNAKIVLNYGSAPFAGVPNAVVTMRFDVTSPSAPPVSPFVSCTTSSFGGCSIPFASYTDATKIVVTVTSVTGAPPPAVMPTKTVIFS